MSLADWIGFAGVSLLLLAFLLNLFQKISQASILYSSLNLVGAALACLASVLLMYWPFIVLEGIWTLVSAIAVVHYLRTK